MNVWAPTVFEPPANVGTPAGQEIAGGVHAVPVNVGAIEEWEPGPVTKVEDAPVPALMLAVVCELWVCAEFVPAGV